MKKLNRLAVKVLSVLLAIILLSSQNVFAETITGHRHINTDTSGIYPYNKDDVDYYKSDYSQGGAFEVDSATLEFTGKNAHFIENEAKTSGGGAIYSDRGKVYIKNTGVEFSSNTAKTNGGAIYHAGDESKYFEIKYDAKFKTNQAEEKGGAVYNEAVFRMYYGGDFTENTAKNYGGAIYNKGTFEIYDNVIKFTKNESLNNDGGAIYNEGTFEIDYAEFTGNTAKGFGGAIYNYGTFKIYGGIEFTGNKTARQGGAIYNCKGRTFEILNNAKFKENESKDYGGGAIYNEGTFTIKNEAEFTGNTAKVQGGAIYNHLGTFTIQDGAIFKDNKAGIGSGGAIYNQETFIIGKNAEFTNNCSEEQDGGAIDNTGTFTIQDGAIFKGNTAKGKGGAIYNNGTLNLIAKTNNIEFTGNKANGVSNAIYNYDTANLWASENANIIFNDRITGLYSTININSSTTTVTTKGKVVLNEDMSGYKGTTNFYGGTIELGENGKWFGGKVNVVDVDNATINFANGLVEEHNFNTVKVSGNLNLPVVNADLKNEKMDTISSATEFEGAGKITVNKVKVIKDTKEKEVTITFADDNLKDKVEFSGNVETLKYKYTATYDDTTGAFTFVNEGGINMASAASAVASSVGGYATQSVVINQAFAGIDRQMAQKVQPKTVAPKAPVKPSQESSLTPTDKKQPAKTNNKQNKKSANINSSNLYVSAGNQIFDDSTTIERSLWLRPFALQETIKLNGVDIDNTLYGTLAGIDLPVGQDKQLSFYIGYAGSKQEFDEVKTNQTGYLVGLTGMLVKEKWYLGLTVNGIFNKVSADSEDETNDFDMNMFTIGGKAGYNIDLSDKWILEPNITVMYGIANSDSYETTLGSIDSQSTSNILVEPQVKAKWQLTNGWQPYGLVGYSANLSNKPKVKAGGEELELDSIDGFVEYGIGVNKEFIGSVWSCYGQVTGRSGGRNGFGGNLGIKYKF